MTVLGLRCYKRAFSSCSKGSLHCDARASYRGGFSYCRAGFSSCGVWVQLPCSMWDLSGPGIKPSSPALAGGFLTTGSQARSSMWFLIASFLLFVASQFVCYNTRSLLGVRTTLPSEHPSPWWNSFEGTVNMTHFPFFGRIQKGSLQALGFWSFSSRLPESFLYMGFGRFPRWLSG